jgi:hypothetical protein
MGVNKCGKSFQQGKWASNGLCKMCQKLATMQVWQKAWDLANVTKDFNKASGRVGLSKNVTKACYKASVAKKHGIKQM